MLADKARTTPPTMHRGTPVHFPQHTSRDVNHTITLTCDANSDVAYYDGQTKYEYQGSERKRQKQECATSSLTWNTTSS